MKIGESIRAYRKVKGLTQENIEQKCGISQSYLSQIEKDIKEPNLSTLKTLCDCIDIPLPLLIFSAIEEKDVDLDKRELLKELQPLFEDLFSNNS